MRIYRVETPEGAAIVLNTEAAQDCWPEAIYWDGSNQISKATGSQWNHETLYRSARGQQRARGPCRRGDEGVK
jgi:hypothetical protein